MWEASGCLVWTGVKTRDGYGRFRVFDGKWVYRPAHRFLYERVMGKIGGGLTLDHLCRNRACINPAHLEPVTMRENLLRGATIVAANAKKTHCKRGHILAGDNLYRHKGKTWRDCLACRTAYSRKGRD